MDLSRCGIELREVSRCWLIGVDDTVQVRFEIALLVVQTLIVVVKILVNDTSFSFHLFLSHHANFRFSESTSIPFDLSLRFLLISALETTNNVTRH